LLLSAQGAPLPPAPVNAGFETFDASGAPQGWTVAPYSPASHYAAEAVQGRTGKALRIHATGAAGEGERPGVVVFQNIDATALRGKRVRLRASFKVDRPGQFVALGMAVTRPPPKAAGFRDTMEDRPFAASDWGVQQLTGRVAADATQIWIAISVRGDGDATVDDLTLEAVPADPTPPSAEAQAYLMRAIRIVRSQHIDSRTADWPRIIADAREDIAGAQTPTDTYPAIRGVLGALGEKHSFFMPPSSVKRNGASGSGTPPPPEMPASELVDGRFGVVRLPALGTIGPDGAEIGRRYTETLRTALQTMDKAPICGWIVDLRGNGGGNMWPMLNGLDPLLGRAPFGSFVDPAGNLTRWQRARGQILPLPAEPERDSPAFGLAHGRAPLAVLIGPQTASSGEMTAVAFVGRPGVRTFGADSAGYTTGNSPIPLSDGAMLVITGVFIRDRTGRSYDGPVTPDVRTRPEDAQAEAVHWLAGQCPAK